MAKSVKIYSTPTCPYCVKAKQYLTENNIPFENFDVSSDDAKREEMIKKSGQMGVPVLDVGGEIIIGFDKEAIKRALGI